jgi:hypothetical protein
MNGSLVDTNVIIRMLHNDTEAVGLLQKAGKSRIDKHTKYGYNIEGISFIASGAVGAVVRGRGAKPHGRGAALPREPRKGLEGCGAATPRSGGAGAKA